MATFLKRAGSSAESGCGVRERRGSRCLCFSEIQGFRAFGECRVPGSSIGFRLLEFGAADSGLGSQSGGLHV